MCVISRCRSASWMSLNILLSAKLQIFKIHDGHHLCPLLLLLFPSISPTRYHPFLVSCGFSTLATINEPCWTNVTLEAPNAPARSPQTAQITNFMQQHPSFIFFSRLVLDPTACNIIQLPVFFLFGHDFSQLRSFHRAPLTSSLDVP